jgi:predicted dehydrogenase
MTQQTLSVGDQAGSSQGASPAVFRSVFVGCGPRAKRHAEAYRHVRSFRSLAAADLDAARLNAFADAFGLPARYGDFRAMLAEQRPDLVHCVTQPSFRVEPVEACAEAGVRAIILEKPLANTLADAQRIRDIAHRTGIKVIVNTQRRYYASWHAACAPIRDGRAGAVRSVRVWSNPSIACVGSHMIDLVQSLLGDVEPDSVWATATDAEDYHTNHPGPASVLARLIYSGSGSRVVVNLDLSKHGVGTPGCPGFWMSGGVEIVAERGFVRWTDTNGWTAVVDGQPTLSGSTNFVADDALGQAAFTEAIADWLRDESKPHGNRLETALRVYGIVAAIIQSAARGRHVSFGQEPIEDCWQELRQKLVANEGDHPGRVDWKTCRDAAPPLPFREG